MRIGPLGTREIVASALLLVAVIAGISVTFLRADNESQKNAAARLNPTATPGDNGEQVAATDAPGVTIDPPEAWLLQYADISRSDGSLIVASAGSVEELDLDFAGAPFGDMRDNQWGLIAEGLVSGDEGNWTFTLEFQGAIKVELDGVILAEGTSPDLETLDLQVPRGAGQAQLRIEARDADGQFTLRWVE